MTIDGGAIDDIRRMLSVVVVVAVHHALGGRANNRAAHGANGCAHRATGQTDDATGHRARGGGAAHGGVRFTRIGGGVVDVAVQLGVIVPIHTVPPVLEAANM